MIVQLVYGRLDGVRLNLPERCPCCGGEIVPGSVFTSEQGERYILAPNMQRAIEESMYARYLEGVS